MESTKFKMSHHPVGPVEVIDLTGQLDSDVATPIREQFKSIIADGRTKLILNLSELKFLDSSGLSTFVTALKAARATGGDVLLLNVPPSIRSLIELTRLHLVFELFDNKDQAIAKLIG